MQKIDFDEAVSRLVKNDPRYTLGAYHFMRDALDATLRQVRQDGQIEDRHVSGKELVEGIRNYALMEFGPMVMTVFEEWGIHSCADFGEIVFNLIEARVFGKTDDDKKENFVGHYDFEEAFVRPFLPKGQTARKN
ncbi:MAG: putative repeat protein (TIGR04138 family) [Verrucomicrobiales bacterium]|jgi:uncharacterized repeat protein (TIGR04138 family)